MGQNSGIPLRAKRLKGLTLVELMVTLVIGLIVVLVVARLFLGGRSAQRDVDERAAMMESGQMVLELLGREVANAAFYPAVSTEAVLPSGASGTNVLASFEVAVSGLNGGLVPEVYQRGLSGCSNGVLNAASTACENHPADGALGSDTLVVSYFTNDAFSLDVGHRADCTRSDVANSAYNVGRTGTVTVQNEEGEDVEQARGPLGLPPASPLLVANAYFLVPVQYVEPGGRQVNTFALACRGNGNPASTVELVTGIEQLNIRFGVFSDDSLRPSQFLTATEMASLQALVLPDGTTYQPWQRVVAARLCVMVRSQSSSRFNDGGAAKSITDCAGDQMALPAGVNMEVFTQVVGVKNRQMRTVGL